MSIPIYSNSKIFVVAPAFVATGGPELLHQLVYHLRNDLGYNAFMYYYPNTHTNPIHPEYQQYNNPFVKKIEDKEENILIVPEIKDGIEQLNHYKRIRKIIWWLSVNNFYFSFLKKKDFLIQRLVNKFFNIVVKEKIFDVRDLLYRKISNEEIARNFFKKNMQITPDFHLAQSYYALNHLKEVIGINDNLIYYLSDYLNPSFLNIEIDINQKKNIVLYNPKKGFSFTKKIIKRSSNITFIPLINFTRNEMIGFLKKAKVYIDFGDHPGKDRIPREAAILGCCVLTGKKGSAYYYKDVPIPNEYKFKETSQNIKKIIEKIQECFNNFEEKYNDFDCYRQIIKKEPDLFLQDLKKIFGKSNITKENRISIK